MSQNNEKKLDFYKNGKIYRIVCNQTGLQYIGSTCKTLKQRLQQHKTSYKGYKDGNGHYITSFKILEKNDYAIVLIEDYPCERKELLNARERHYIESMTCVNKNCPNKFIELGRVEYNKQRYDDNRDEINDRVKKYYADNKDKKLDYQKEYDKKNRDKIIQYKKEKLLCPHCGCSYRRDGKSTHQKTKKHQTNSASDSDSTISDITI